MTLFYVPNLLPENTLPPEESLHAVKVLRLQTGSEIIIVNGTGGYFKARITQPHPKHCGYEIIESKLEYGKRNYKLHIAIAPTKNIERLEWFIEKATEIGIDEITPIICRFSERKIIKEERLEKIIISAAKQSIKAYFPTLHPLCTFDELINKYPTSQKFIAHCYSSPTNQKNNTDEQIFKKELLQNVLKKNLDTLILIGPEGDFSMNEVEKALSLGCIPISLGESRLRTETAGLVACHTVALVHQK